MLLKEASLSTSFSSLKASFIRKPFDFGEVESMEDDTDDNLMEMEDQSSMNLFSDSPAGSASDANVSGEGQSTIGKYIFPAWDFFYLSVMTWHYKRPHRYQYYAHFIFPCIVYYVCSFLYTLDFSDF